MGGGKSKEEPIKASVPQNMTQGKKLGSRSQSVQGHQQEVLRPQKKSKKQVIGSAQHQSKEEKFEMFLDFLFSDEWLRPINKFIEGQAWLFQTPNQDDFMSDKQQSFEAYRQILTRTLDNFLNNKIGIQRSGLADLCKDFADELNYDDLVHIMALEDMSLFHSLMHRANVALAKKAQKRLAQNANRYTGAAQRSAPAQHMTEEQLIEQAIKASEEQRRYADDPMDQEESYAAAVAASMQEEKKRKQRRNQETDEEEQIRLAIEALYLIFLASKNTYAAEEARGQNTKLKNQMQTEQDRMQNEYQKMQMGKQELEERQAMLQNRNMDAEKDIENRRIEVLQRQNDMEQYAKREADQVKKEKELAMKMKQEAESLANNNNKQAQEQAKELAKLKMQVEQGNKQLEQAKAQQEKERQAAKQAKDEADKLKSQLKNQKSAPVPSNDDAFRGTGMHFNESEDAKKNRMMGALGAIGGGGKAAPSSKKKAPMKNNYAAFAVAEESEDSDDERAISAYIDTLTKYAYDQGKGFFKDFEHLRLCILARDREKHYEGVRDIEADLSEIKMSYKMRSALPQAQKKYFEQLAIDKELYERENMRGNVQVYARMRPTKNPDPAFDIGDRYIDLTQSQGMGRKKETHFLLDGVFTQDQTNDDVWRKVEPFVKSSLMGDNICMFAYGQTGSGKTHTLTSVTTAAAQLMIDEMNFSKFDLKVSSLQIYLEKVQDLLNGGKEVGLAITADKKLDLKGQTWRYIDSIEAFNKAREDSHENLKVSATKYNAQSSRSHHIFQFKITKGSGQHQRQSTLNITDLAGSEPFGMKDKAQEAEGKFIRVSLFALQRAFSDKVFRDSVLTRILENALAASTGKVICLLALNEEQKEQTIKTLEFGQVAYYQKKK